METRNMSITAFQDKKWAHGFEDWGKHFHFALLFLTLRRPHSGYRCLFPEPNRITVSNNDGTEHM